METGETIAWIVGIILVLLILQAVMPYVVVFLALCGAYYLWVESQKRR